MKNAKYIKIGQEKPKDLAKCVYELMLFEYVIKLEPPSQLQIESFDPDDYYITSGDAVRKAIQLKKDVYIYAGKVRTLLNTIKKPNKDSKQFEKLCWAMTGKCVKLINDLEKARGDAIFFETEWDETHLKCIPKNPRAKQPTSS